MLQAKERDTAFPCVSAAMLPKTNLPLFVVLQEQSQTAGHDHVPVPPEELAAGVDWQDSNARSHHAASAAIR